MKTLFARTGLLLLCFFCMKTAAAQENFHASFSQHRNALGLRIGLNRFAMLDQNTSGLIYSGNIPMVGIEYTTYGENGYFTANLHAGRGGFFAKNYPDRTIQFIEQDVYGHTDTITVPMRGNSTLGRLELGYLRKVNPGDDLEFAAGGMLSEEAFYQDGFVTPGLMNVAAFSPAVQASWAGSGNYFLSVGITVPIVALVSRSAYHNTVSLPDHSKLKGFFEQGTRLESFSRHRQVKCSISLHRMFGNRWMGGLEYDFRAVKNSWPRTLNLTQHEVGLSMQYIY